MSESTISAPESLSESVQKKPGKKRGRKPGKNTVKTKLEAYFGIPLNDIMHRFIPPKTGRVEAARILTNATNGEIEFSPTTLHEYFRKEKKRRLEAGESLEGLFVFNAIRGSKGKRKKKPKDNEPQQRPDNIPESSIARLDANGTTVEIVCLNCWETEEVKMGIFDPENQLLVKTRQCKKCERFGTLVAKFEFEGKTYRKRVIEHRGVVKERFVDGPSFDHIVDHPFEKKNEKETEGINVS